MTEDGLDVLATLHGNDVVVTVLNTDVKKGHFCRLALGGEVTEAQALNAKNLLPHNRFEEAVPQLDVQSDAIGVQVPPCSAVKLRIRLTKI